MSDLTLRLLLLGEDKSAGAAVTGLGKKVAGLPGALAGPLGKLGSLVGGEAGEIVAKMSEAFEKVGEGSEGLGSRLQKTGGALAGIGAGAALFGSKEKAGTEQLKAAIEAVGGSYSESREEIEKTIKTQENYGHSAADTQQALQVLTASTGDPAKAFEHMSLVSNLAASQHEKLADAANQVAKILAGKGTRTLATYGITTKDTGKATEELSQKLSGQATAAVTGWSGKLDVLKTKLGDHVAILGQKYGPALTVAGTGLTALGTVMEFVRGRQAAAALATEGETAASKAQAIASKLAAGAQWLLNAAMEANPIGLIVIAIIALVAAFVLAWKHSETFRAIVTGAFSAVKNAVSAVVTWIRNNWPLLLAILTGPIGLAVLAISRHWTTIKNDALAVKSWIVNRWAELITFFAGLPGKIGRVASGLFDGFKDAFRAAINWIISGWNNLRFTIPSIDTHIPGVGKVGGMSVGVPAIPLLAAGGTIMRGGSVIVGDAGPEILNLPRGAQVSPLGRGGVTELHIHVTQPLGTPQQIARAVIPALELVSNSGTPLRIKIAS